MYRLLLLSLCLVAAPALAAAADANAPAGEAAKDGPHSPSVLQFPTQSGPQFAQAVFDVSPPRGWTVFGKTIPETTVLMVLMALIIVLLGLVVAQLAGLKAAIEKSR